MIDDDVQLCEVVIEIFIITLNVSSNKLLLIWTIQLDVSTVAEASLRMNVSIFVSRSGWRLVIGWLG